MRRGAFVMYPSHVALLNFKAEFRRHSIDNSSAPVGFIHVGHQHDLDDIEGAYYFEKFDRRHVRTAFQAVTLKYMVTQTTLSKE